MRKLLKISLKASLFLTSFCSIYAQNSISLFNGEDLNNWEFALEDKSVNPADIFFVKDSIINIKGTPFGYMFTKQKYKNFVLHVEWAYPFKKTNSGIFLFIQNDNKDVWPKAVECQLAAGDAGDFVLLNGADIDEYKTPKSQERPKFPILKKLHPSNEKDLGQYNTADIVCQDGKVSVYINGTLQNIAHSKVKSGHIALQSEGEDILFKNVRLIPLD